MALGFTSHYKQGEQTTFGALTQSAYNTDVEASGTVAYTPSLIMGQDFTNSMNYDSCEFSSTVIIDYSQYASIADGGSSSETAGSIAYVGGSDFSGGGSVASFSGGGGAVSFSGGGCGSGGVSCASFTC